MPPRKEKPMAYYEFTNSYHGGVPGWQLINSDRLQVGKIGTSLNNWEPWPDGHLVLPRDIVRWSHFFLISKVVKDVIETVAPGSCAFVRCETVTSTGEPARETWLCSATTVFLGAVVREESKGLEWRVGPTGKPCFTPRRTDHMDVKLHHEIIGSAHLFRLAENPPNFFCDDVFKDTCKKAGIKGARFLPFGH